MTEQKDHVPDVGKKVIAVEWLYNHLFPKQIDGFSLEEWNKIDKAFEQAKQMEKEQHKNTWDNASIDASYGSKYKSFEQYYNETYNAQ